MDQALKNEIVQLMAEQAAKEFESDFQHRRQILIVRHKSEQLKETLAPEAYNQAMELLDAQFFLGTLREDYMYQQGILDGIKLLKTIGILL